MPLIAPSNVIVFNYSIHSIKTLIIYIYVQDPGVFKAKCKDDSDCKKGQTLPAGNGKTSNN